MTQENSSVCFSREFRVKQAYFDSQNEIIPPRHINQDTELAVEHTIGLYELICLLELLYKEQIPTTYIFHCYDPRFYRENGPTIRDVMEAVNLLSKGPSEDDHIHYYDFMSLAYWAPDVIGPRNHLPPYQTIYPLPAFFNGVFDLDINSHNVSFQRAIQLFLGTQTNSRALLLPRSRCKGEDIRGDFLNVVKYLTADHQEEALLLPPEHAEDEYDLALMPDFVLLENGISVIRVNERGELVTLPRQNSTKIYTNHLNFY